MTVDRQKIIFYEDEDDIATKKIVIPKVINTDISFELMFGIEAPKGRWDIKNTKIENLYYTEQINKLLK